MHRQLVFALLLVLGPGCATLSPRRPVDNWAMAPTLPRAPVWQFEQLPHRTTDAAAEPDETGDVDDELVGSTDSVAPAEPASAAAPDLTVLKASPLQAGQSSGYGWRKDPFRHRRKFHSGTDYPSSAGTPVAAAGDGVVSFAGRRGGYGNMVLIDHGGGVSTLYGHLRRIEVENSANVTAGDRIGQVGQTGRATGPHLHFEVRIDGRPVDPVMAMAAGGTERSSPNESKVVTLASTAGAQPSARPESGSRVRPKRGSHLRRTHGKRPQLLW